jgi:hypothetical protein
MEGSGGDLIYRYYPVIRLEELRKTMKNLSHDSRSPGRDLTNTIHIQQISYTV